METLKNDAIIPIDLDDALSLLVKKPKNAPYPFKYGTPYGPNLPDNRVPYIVMEHKSAWTYKKGGNTGYSNLGNWINNTNSNVGREHPNNSLYNNKIVWSAKGDPEGHMMYGPYVDLPGNRYIYEFWYLLQVVETANVLPNEVLGYIDVCHNEYGKVEIYQGSQLDLTKNSCSNWQPSGGMNFWGKWGWYKGFVLHSGGGINKNIEARVYTCAKTQVAIGAIHVYKSPF